MKGVSGWVIRLNVRSALQVTLIALVMVLAISGSTARASLCQTVTVSSTYPHQASPGQRIQLETTVAGSCTSDGEDYFSVRVDLANSVSKSIISSNSTAIGYNANNFSVSVENFATAPMDNGTWSIEVNTYMAQAGGVSGKYLLNATTATIQVGDTPLPEFQLSGAAVFILALSAIPLTLWQRKARKKTRRS